MDPTAQPSIEAEGVRVIHGNQLLMLVKRTAFLEQVNAQLFGANAPLQQQCAVLRREVEVLKNANRSKDAQIARLLSQLENIRSPRTSFSLAVGTERSNTTSQPVTGLVPDVGFSPPVVDLQSLISEISRGGGTAGTLPIVVQESFISDVHSGGGTAIAGASSPVLAHELFMSEVPRDRGAAIAGASPVLAREPLISEVDEGGGTAVAGAFKPASINLAWGGSLASFPGADVPPLDPFAHMSAEQKDIIRTRLLTDRGPNSRRLNTDSAAALPANDSRITIEEASPQSQEGEKAAASMLGSGPDILPQSSLASTHQDTHGTTGSDLSTPQCHENVEVADDSETDSECLGEDPEMDEAAPAETGTEYQGHEEDDVTDDNESEEDSETETDEPLRPAFDRPADDLAWNCKRAVSAESDGEETDSNGELEATLLESAPDTPVHGSRAGPDGVGACAVKSEPAYGAAREDEYSLDELLANDEKPAHATKAVNGGQPCSTISSVAREGRDGLIEGRSAISALATATVVVKTEGAYLSGSCPPRYTHHLFSLKPQHDTTTQASRVVHAPGSETTPTTAPEPQEAVDECAAASRTAGGVKITAKSTDGRTRSNGKSAQAAKPFDNVGDTPMPSLDRYIHATFCSWCAKPRTEWEAVAMCERCPRIACPRCAPLVGTRISEVRGADDVVLPSANCRCLRCDSNFPKPRGARPEAHLLQQLLKHDLSVQFRTPVNVRDNPDYPGYVSREYMMDLGTVVTKMESRKYQTARGQRLFRRDIQQIWLNCWKYAKCDPVEDVHVPGIVSCAVILAAMVGKFFKSYIPEMALTVDEEAWATAYERRNRERFSQVARSKSSVRPSGALEIAPSVATAPKEAKVSCSSDEEAKWEDDPKTAGIRPGSCGAAGSKRKFDDEEECRWLAKEGLVEQVCDMADIGQDCLRRQEG